MFSEVESNVLEMRHNNQCLYILKIENTRKQTNVKTILLSKIDIFGVHVTLILGKNTGYESTPYLELECISVVSFVFP